MAQKYTTEVSIDVNQSPVEWMQHPTATWHDNEADAESEMRRLMNPRDGRFYAQAFRVVDEAGNRAGVSAF